MDEKQKKLSLLEESASNMGLTREEVVDFFTKLTPVKKPKKSRPKIDIAQVKVGMIWYEDDTFSFDRLPNKKIKAVIELIEDDIIYGDLTASELFEIEEQDLNWRSAMRYINNFSYPCKKNEKIVLYSIKQFENLCATYTYVRRTFDRIHKRCREYWYWSSTENSAYNAWALLFNYGGRNNFNKYNSYYVRPVLALKV